MGHHQRIIFWLAGLVNFGVSASVATMSPFFPQEAKSRGMDATTASLVFGAYPLSALVSSALMTRLVPVFGPKNVFVGGSAAIGVGNVAFGLLIYVGDLKTFTIYCFIIRVLMGTGSGANITATYTYVASTFTEKISMTLGLLEAFTSLGLCAGPAVGGLLFEVGGYSLPFYAVGAYLLLLLPINVCVMPPIKGQPQKSPSYGRVFGYFPIYVTLGTVAMVTMVFAFLEATFAQHLAERFSMSPRSIGLVFLLYAVCYGLASPLFGRLSDVLRQRLLMVGCALALGSVSMVCIAPPQVITFLPSDELWLTLLSLCLGAAMCAATMIPTFAILCDFIKGPIGMPDDIKTDALVSSMFQTSFYVGCVVGAAISGYLVDHIGYRLAVAAVSGITFTWGLLTIITGSVLGCCCRPVGPVPLPAAEKAAGETAPITSDFIDESQPSPRPRSRHGDLDLSRLSIRESGGYKAFLSEVGSLSPPPERADRTLEAEGNDWSSAAGDSSMERAGSEERVTGLRGKARWLFSGRRRSSVAVGGAGAKASSERVDRLVAERNHASSERLAGSGGEKGRSRERMPGPEDNVEEAEELRIAEMIKNADLHELQELLRSPVETSPTLPPPW